MEIITSTEIDHYVIRNGQKGFTNKEIKDHFKDRTGFEREWKNYKARARRSASDGTERMYYENGKYHF